MKWRWLVVGVAVATTLAVLRCRSWVQGVVDPWMTCIDCLDGELDSVAAQGWLVVGTLADYAANGAPAERIARVRSVEDSAYARRRRWAVLRASPDTALIQPFGNVFAANVDRAYHLRAIVALHRINSRAANSAIAAAFATGRMSTADSLRAIQIVVGPP